MIELIKPSVWRRASRNTARSVSAVRIASGEYQAWPPRVVRGSARQAAIASSLNQIVKASALAQARVLRRPICHPALLFRDVVATRGIDLERHGGNLGSNQRPSFYPIRPTAPASRS